MSTYHHSWLDGPSIPGPTESDIRELRASSFTGKNHLGLKEAVAAKLAIEHVERGKRRQYFWAGGPYGIATIYTSFKKRLPCQVFHQLDKELFRGVLRGKVYLTGQWNRAPDSHGITYRAGHPNGRITICLQETLLHEPPEVILAALIHHMAHAYFLVCCGYGSDEDSHNLMHGLPISTLLHTIQECFLIDNNRFRFPNLFFCTTQPGRHPGPRSPFLTEGQSYCYWHLDDYRNFDNCYTYLHQTLRPLKADDKKNDDGEESFEVEKHFPRSQFLHLYRAGVAILDPIPRSQYEMRHHPSTFLELHYRGRAIPVEMMPLHRTVTFGDNPTEQQRQQESVLDVPKDVNNHTFKNLVHFLTHHTYRPDFLPTLGVPPGPPKIDTGSANVAETGACVPTEDVRVYAVAQKLACEELRRYALRRLYSQTLLRGDPMDFVDEVYTGKEPGKDKPVATGKEWAPDRDLRDFMKAFLVQEHPDRRRVEVDVNGPFWREEIANAATDAALGGLGLGLGSMKQTNLNLLKGHKWQERLMKLRGKGGEFLEDLDAAEEMIGDGRRPEIPSWMGVSMGGWSPPYVPAGLNEAERAALLGGDGLLNPLGVGYGYTGAGTTTRLRVTDEEVVHRGGTGVGAFLSPLERQRVLMEAMRLAYGVDALGAALGDFGL